MDFDLVAISSLSAQVKEAYALAERYHVHGVPVVMGGLHVTSVPDEPARHGATAVLGEGELAWPLILEDAARGTLKPVYDLRGQEFNLADAPMPAFELLDMNRYNRITVQTSRGCPWRCSFCASSILLTRKYKQKPAAKVLAELDRDPGADDEVRAAASANGALLAQHTVDRMRALLPAELLPLKPSASAAPDAAAARRLRDALELSQARDAAAWTTAGDLLRLRGEPQAALAAYERALADAPDAREVLMGKAEALFEIGRAHV